jgi:hypothetical protein
MINNKEVINRIKNMNSASTENDITAAAYALLTNQATEGPSIQEELFPLESVSVISGKSTQMSVSTQQVMSPNVGEKQPIVAVPHMKLNKLLSSISTQLGLSRGERIKARGITTKNLKAIARLCEKASNDTITEHMEYMQKFMNKNVKNYSNFVLVSKEQSMDFALVNEESSSYKNSIEKLDAKLDNFDHWSLCLKSVLQDKNYWNDKLNLPKDENKAFTMLLLTVSNSEYVYLTQNNPEQKASIAWKNLHEQYGQNNNAQSTLQNVIAYMNFNWNGGLMDDHIGKFLKLHQKKCNSKYYTKCFRNYYIS